MPALTTARLRCSPLLAADWPFFLALQQNAEVMRYVAQDRSVADIRDAFDARLQPWKPGSAHWLCLVVRDAQDDMPLGVTGYVHREDDCAEVGFLFAPPAQGKGYGYESLKALCDFAFAGGGIRRLTATVTSGNIASRRVLEKVGFRLEGELRESYFLAGRWHNDWLFGLLKNEY
ncbi:TPA: GNAT family N-acetyltransferase [Enterobacter cancerogenus]|nr:GNAT family N-acetyltransferase [Enterobacter chengduensis]